MLPSLFGDSTFMIIVFMSIFMLVMCFAEAFVAMYRLGFNIARDSIRAVSSAVTSVVMLRQQIKKNRKRRSH